MIYGRMVGLALKLLENGIFGEHVGYVNAGE